MTSRVLYRIEHYTSFPAVAIAIIVAMIGLIAAGAAIGFPSGWVAAFEVSASAVTIVMVFAIQHTQGKESRRQPSGNSTKSFVPSPAPMNRS